MKLEETHLSYLKVLGVDRHTWSGQKLRSYAESVLGESHRHDASNLINEVSNRRYLFTLTEDRTVSTKICCAAIFGWGGMRRNNARDCFAVDQLWMPIVEDMRLNKLSRVDAYCLFRSLRLDKRLPGLGPAFFTKLIYFFGKNSISRGYIMDQWTARSANLLLGRQLIHLVKHKDVAWVSDLNSENVYEEFCQFIEFLSGELSVGPDAAEEIIFSSGNTGKKQTRGGWREYVLTNG
jgi:hypothetical protein